MNIRMCVEIVVKNVSAIRLTSLVKLLLHATM